VIERFAYRPLRDAPRIAPLISALGVSFFLANSMQLLFGATPRNYDTFSLSNGALYLRGIDIGNVRLPLLRIITICSAFVLMVLLWFLVNRTRTGMSIMATGMDRGAARLMGIRARHVYALTFGIAAGLAGMAGAMIGTVGTFNPSAAASFTLMSFVVAVLGGLGNMYGALVGGLVIGLVQAWGGQYLPGTWVNALAFLVLIVVLIFRPTGLVGRAFYAARLEV